MTLPRHVAGHAAAHAASRGATPDDIAAVLKTFIPDPTDPFHTDPATLTAPMVEQMTDRALERLTSNRATLYRTVYRVQVSSSDPSYTGGAIPGAVEYRLAATPPSPSVAPIAGAIPAGAEVVRVESRVYAPVTGWVTA